MSQLELKDKTVWITGASRGIGLAIAKILNLHGCRIILSARALDRPEKILYEFNHPANVELMPCDISSEKDVAEVYMKILNLSGKVDILINNAGVTKFDSFQNSTTENFDEIMGINLRGTFLCTKAVIDSMVSDKKGIILNIISVAAIKTFRNSSLYAASKAGVLAMSRGLREEVRRDGVKVIDILPGATHTDIWDKESLQKYGEKMMHPDAIANVVFETIKLCLDDKLLIEEIVLRPQGGDL